MLLGEVPRGNRKNIRNAVEAARRAEQWSSAGAHSRAQVLYYLAENLSQRGKEIVARLAAVVGKRQASEELRLSVERLFTDRKSTRLNSSHSQISYVVFC